MTGIVAHRSLVDAFAAAAAAHAGRTAIEDGDRSVSYRQLEERAGRMAARFVRAGLVPGDRVALLLEPGIDAVAAMFGALRIGAAYVPLDPADPPARLEALLRDAGPRALATAPDRVPEARALVGDDVAVLAADDDEPIEAPGPAPALAPDTIAFVMYTSGSTGEPKGVLQTHGNLLHYIEQYASTLRIAPSDRHSMLYSLSFSASSMDVYGALLNGATLCFLNVRRLGVAPLAGWIDEKRITILHTVPSLFRHLAGLADGVPGRFASVRAIDLGGEMVTPSDVDLWRAHFRPDSLLVNHLAATEISVIAQYVVPRDGGCDGVVPAGRPAKDVVITILREDGSRAAPGEVGEIVVSSPYVSPGYWRRDALTSAAFSDDPERPGWRRYRSGDRGMLTADGLLVAMGRGDAVVKVRGHSVHLAEVEAALRRDAAVRDAVVIAGRHADERRGTRLIAYVVPDTIDGVALRRRLARRLPRHAIPSAIHPISALPRTPTGKIDRRALESGAYDRAARPVGRSALADPLEQEVASIFVRLLEIADVDRGDDFFELGGDSLLLLALQEELQRAFGCEIQAEDLLLDASVGAVAALVRRAKERAAAGEVVPAAEPGAARLIALRTSGSGRPLFLVHGGTGVAGASPALLDALGREQPLYGFQARGYDGGAPPHDSVADMAAEYLELLRRVQPRGPYFLGAVCAGAVVALEMAQRLREAGERVAPLLLIDPPAPHCGRPALPSLINRVGLAIGARLLGGRVTERVAVRLLRRRFGDHELRRVARHDDPGRAGARLRVRVQFSRAAHRHRPRPYDGPVDIVGSRQRLAFVRSGWWDGILTGPVRTFEAGLEHRDIFDTGNHEIARQLAGRVEDAQRWMAQAPSEDGPAHDLRDAWEAKWRRPDFTAPWLGRGAPPELVRAVSDGWLAPGTAALDIGCGEGDVAAWLAQHGFPAVGVDIAPAAVERARSRFREAPGSLEFHALDICAAPPRDWHGRFGVLIDRGCFHQLPAAAVPGYAASLSALSRPGARLLLFVKAFRTGQSPGEEEERRRVRAAVDDALGAVFRIERVEATWLDPDEGRNPATALPGLVFWMTKAC